MIVLTACYSRNPCRPYDQPKRAPAGVQAYAYTDDPLWYEAGWLRPPHERNNLLLHSRMRGKAPKCAPHLLHDDDDVIWIDSSMVWLGVPLQTLIDEVPAGGVGCFRHRFRDCIYDEADASLEMGFNRYAREPIRAQVEHYRQRGQRAHAGLWELGCIAWRGEQRYLGAPWLAEILTWTSQDQISFARICNARGMRPTELPGNAVRNKWFAYQDHVGDE